MQPAARWLPIAPLLFAGAVSAQYYEARNSGMGGVGAASSDYLAAGWGNPALLTRGRAKDAFGVLLPTVGATAYDRDGLVDDIRDFADEYDRLDLAGGGTAIDRNRLADQLESLDTRSVTLNVGFGAMLAAPSTALGVALHAKSFTDLQGFVDVDPADVDALRNPGALPSLLSQARIVGAAITEVGLSLATEVGDDGQRVALGITPKYQRIDTYNYAVVPNDFEVGDFDGRQFTNDDAAFNVDVGAAWRPGAGFTLGVTGRNLVGRSYTTVDTLARRYVYRVDPTAVVGVAWAASGFTLAIDLDLLTVDRFTSGDGLGDDDTRPLRFGGEFDLNGWLQLRTGYQTDLEDAFEDAVSAGLGFVALGLLRFDLAGTYVDQDSFGAFAQFGLMF